MWLKVEASGADQKSAMQEGSWATRRKELLTEPLGVFRLKETIQVGSLGQNFYKAPI